MHLFHIASQHRAWLAQRQAVVAANIANANTPGYQARAVTGDFASLLTRSPVAPQATHPAHIKPEPTPAAAGVEPTEPEHETHSGNSVDVPTELMAAGEVKSAYTLNVSIIKAFHRMVQTGVRT